MHGKPCKGVKGVRLGLRSRLSTKLMLSEDVRGGFQEEGVPEKGPEGGEGLDIEF